jgi:hypothetical protein
VSPVAATAYGNDVAFMVLAMTMGALLIGLVHRSHR